LVNKLSVFDRDSYPTAEPRDLVPAEFWAWQRPDVAAHYPPETHSAEYIFYSLEGKAHFTVPTVELAGNYLVEHTPADTGSGPYKWVLKVTHTATGRSATVSEGIVHIRPHATEEVRSHNLKVLQAIRATIEQTASKEQANYSIAGRALSRRTPAELMDLERIYSKRWASEQKEIDRKNGRQAKSNKTLVSF